MALADRSFVYSPIPTLGGESIYGEPFLDEFHQRLRFSHRGVLGMANDGTPNANRSQFFFCLDRADELYRKHTVFGKVTGDTIFNLLRIGQLETDANERPLHEVRIISTSVLHNPFDDIIPRVRQERRAVNKVETLVPSSSTCFQALYQSIAPGQGQSDQE